MNYLTWRKDVFIFWKYYVFSDMRGGKNPARNFTSNSKGKNDLKKYGDHTSAKSLLLVSSWW
jgi:hypothetical protein